ncbi:MAG TPA: prepilin-type N-terminal cleavage/methylation domain-containing protein [Gammaproteobacteria bacterium]|nr:prepilin-type N-terminal cleavage/methylation domain-containing protein [Gammaproteobacteria bacterium]
MNNPSPQKGFTLIELMIVVAILAIVTTIAVPAYTGYVKTAQRTEGWNNLNGLQLALEEYYIENGKYTTDMTASGLNWTPKPDSGGTNHFTYKVEAGSSSDIKTSYKITATDVSDSSVTFSLSGP